jgi:hypothetical protein
MSRSPAMMNEFQRRGVTAVLRTVEEHLRSIEAMLDQEDYPGILYDEMIITPVLEMESILQRIRDG